MSNVWAHFFISCLRFIIAWFKLHNLHFTFSVCFLNLIYAFVLRFDTRDKTPVKVYSWNFIHIKMTWKRIFLKPESSWKVLMLQTKYCLQLQETLQFLVCRQHKTRGMTRTVYVTTVAKKNPLLLQNITVNPFIVILHFSQWPTVHSWIG